VIMHNYYGANSQTITAHSNLTPTTSGIDASLYFMCLHLHSRTSPQMQTSGLK